MCVCFFFFILRAFSFVVFFFISSAVVTNLRETSPVFWDIWDISHLIILKEN